VRSTEEKTAFVPCSAFVPRVDSAHLDCVSDDIALLLAAHNVADIRSPFGQDWRFDLVERDPGLPVLDIPPADQDQLLGSRTGYTPSWTRTGSVEDAAAQWRGKLSGGAPVLVVGDAYFLPWLPYHGRAHMDHGFVVEGLGEGPNPVTHVVDPYDNVTEWGHAVPVTTSLPLQDLAPALTGGRWATLSRTGSSMPYDPRQQVVRNAAAILAAHDSESYERFIRWHDSADQGRLENLTLQTWLLARNRQLHALWLRDVADDLAACGLAGLSEQFASEVAAAWRRTMEMSYIALRRSRAGRRVPGGLVMSLRAAAKAEASLAGSLAPPMALVAREAARGPIDPQRKEATC
jgi:hypothetical protein